MTQSQDQPPPLDYEPPQCGFTISTRNIVRLILCLIVFLSSAYALLIYNNFPNGGNGSASIRAANDLELSTGVAIAAFAALLLSFRWSKRLFGTRRG